jgi:hypothetical protein
MKIEQKTFDMTLVPTVYLSLGLLCGTKKLITYFPNTTTKGLVASSAISTATAIASACLFKEDSAKRRTALIFSSALSVVLLPEAIKKFYNIEKPSGYPKFFVAQALTYVFLENFRDSSWVEVQPQDNVTSILYQEDKQMTTSK